MLSIEVKEHCKNQVNVRGAKGCRVHLWDLEEKDLTYKNKQGDILPNSIERKRPNNTTT